MYSTPLYSEHPNSQWYNLRSNHYQTLIKITKCDFRGFCAAYGVACCSGSRKKLICLQKLIKYKFKELLIEFNIYSKASEGKQWRKTAEEKRQWTNNKFCFGRERHLFIFVLDENRWWKKNEISLLEESGPTPSVEVLILSCNPLSLYLYPYSRCAHNFAGCIDRNKKSILRNVWRLPYRRRRLFPTEGTPARRTSVRPRGVLA